MKNTISVPLLALLIFPVTSWGQDTEKTLPSAPSSQVAPRASTPSSNIPTLAGSRSGTLLHKPIPRS